MIGFCIYLTFISIAWIISEFSYGDIKNNKRFVRLLSVKDCDDYMRYIQTILGDLNCKVTLSNQQRIVIKMTGDLPHMYPIEIIAENIVYLRGVMEWHCKRDTEYCVKINRMIDGDILRSIAFYEDNHEVFLVQADTFLLSSYNEGVFIKKILIQNNI